MHKHWIITWTREVSKSPVFAVTLAGTTRFATPNSGAEVGMGSYKTLDLAVLERITVTMPGWSSKPVR